MEIIIFFLPAILFLLLAVIITAIESNMRLINNERKFVEIIHELEERIIKLQNERSK